MVYTQINQVEASSAQAVIASKAYAGKKRGRKAETAVILPVEPTLARQLRAHAAKATPKDKTTKKNKTNKKCK